MGSVTHNPLEPTAATLPQLQPCRLLNGVPLSPSAALPSTRLFLSPRPQVVFVGATQRQEILDMAVEAGWLRVGAGVRVGRTHVYDVSSRLNTKP